MSNWVTFGIALASGFIGGFVAWWTSNFVGQSIIEFYRLRRKIHDEIQFVGNIRPQPDVMPNQEARDAIDRIRRLGTQLGALDASLVWPATLLRMRYKIEDASGRLIGLSNTLSDRHGMRAANEWDTLTALKLPTPCKKRPKVREFEQD